MTEETEYGYGDFKDWREDRYHDHGDVNLADEELMEVLWQCWVASRQYAEGITP